MKEIAQAVRVGARAYLKRQYLGISMFFIVVFFILLAMALKNYLVIFVPFAFLTGGILFRFIRFYRYVDCYAVF